MILIPKYSNSIQLVGSVSLVLTDEVSTVKREVYIPNLVVAAGKTYIAARMTEATTTLMDYMALGTSNSDATNAARTTLVAETSGNGYTRASITSSSNLAVATFAATFGGTNPNAEVAIQEAGIFDATTSGNMLCRTTFPVVTKQAGDSLTITWTITVQ